MENKILATVGGQPITENDVNEFLLELGERAQTYNNEQGRAIILKQLIDSKLFLLEAKRNLFEGEAEFRAQLAKIKDNLLATYAAEKAIKAAAKVSDADAEKFYSENPDKFKRGESVNASHILVDSADAALDILAKINSGELSFEDAAIQ